MYTICEDELIQTMILHTWGDFSTQIHFAEVGTKRGTFSLVVIISNMYVTMDVIDDVPFDSISNSILRSMHVSIFVSR